MINFMLEEFKGTPLVIVLSTYVANIEDKLAAIKNELLTREKPHKPYLNEKLDSIYWDVKVLMNISKLNEDDE